MAVEPDIGADGDNKRLNRLVAITVVMLSVFLAICNIKDGNIVQTMQLAKADEVDSWAEYQGTRLKAYIADAALSQLRVQLAAAAGGAGEEALRKEIAANEAIVSRQTTQAADQLKKAQSFRPKLEALGFVDDQFDIAEAFLSIAIATAAVAALAASYPLLIFALGAGAAGVVMGLAGFLGWSFHPEWLVSFLT
jgi:hypothetical protein